MIMNEIRVSQFRDNNFNFAVVITDKDTRAKTPDNYPIHLSSFLGCMHPKAKSNWKKQGWSVFDQRRSK